MCGQFLGLHCSSESLFSNDLFLFTNANLQEFTANSVNQRAHNLLTPISYVRFVWQRNLHFDFIRGKSNHVSIPSISLQLENISQLSGDTLYENQSNYDKKYTLTAIVECSLCRQAPVVPLSVVSNSNFSIQILEATKAELKDTKVYLKLPSASYFPISQARQDSMPLTCQQQGNSLSFVRNGLVLNSLVFISGKIPSSEGVSEVIGPLSVASWIGLALAYAITAIVFGVVKTLTINNLDESLYECVMHQLLKIMNEESVNGTSVIRVQTGKDDTIDSSELHESRRMHRQRNIFSNNTYFSSSQENTREGSDCQITKAILYVTIRVVSFFLIASYEGKLYNSITFPQPHLVATFEELVASDQYSIKVTKEALHIRSLGIPASKSNLSQFSHSSLSENQSLMFPNHKRAEANEMSLPNTSRIIDIVTVEDCISWVESKPDSNACIGYEFELRNLHKTHRFDKLVAKSNKKLFRHGMRRHTGGRRSRLFPGAFQISKWIMESGIMQLWNLAETSFTDTISDVGQMHHTKTFTIKDYIGLFMVYFVLLFLSFVLFLSEFVTRWAKSKYDLNTPIDMCKFARRLNGAVKHFLNILTGGCVQLCEKLSSRSKVHKIVHL
jgi:hypothetical protein